MKLLYIGNKLSTHGLNKTSIETLGAFLKTEGFVVHYSSSKKNLFFRILDMLFNVCKYSRKTDYVLIDTYSTSAFWYAFMVSQLCRVLHVKYIPILRGGDLPNRLKVSPMFCNLLFKNAYKNIAPSHYLLTEFEKAGYTNLAYIPNTIEIQNYNLRQRSVIQPKIIWVRAFAEIYNPKMAVDVLHQIKTYYPNAELCMVGPDKDGSGAATQGYAKSLGLDVRFTGQLSKKEWTTLANDYDIFINTTHFDNTPVSVMEAMALGLPVVSTNVGGIPYLLNHNENALLVADDNVCEMVKAVSLLLEDTVLTDKLSKAGRAKAESWDWQTVKKDWIALLR
ncbi:glycosyltransferase family 4 protein [Flavobacterium sp.]|uniref:glycosyltransferase family 4 protein n=1 Tax=Flavobacterium sp. TaxID=239 RepID=UPI0028BE7A7D|nr:glycosyltransferase family 4 protein [Flavobacterium sp.]